MKLYHAAGYTTVAHTGKMFKFHEDMLPVRMYCILPTIEPNIDIDS